MNMYKVRFSELIRQYRYDKRLTQSDFGKKLGVSAQAVYKWERQVCCPDIMLLPELARILGCKIDEFFE